MERIQISKNELEKAIRKQQVEMNMINSEMSEKKSAITQL